ncbi:MAG: phosphatidylserine decarboxylase [Deltaproteobacteria bacterium]|nr:phosphatidylserine decarboxylase [Deltaproteobacteria bacterium]
MLDMNHVVTLLKILPQNTISRTLGDLARLKMPAYLREPVVTAFARMLGADVREAEKAPGQYKSLADFFTRRLKPGVRTFPGSLTKVACPVDGLLRAIGPVENGRLEQVKGIYYNVDSLLLDPERTSLFRNGDQVNLYLSPSDYHRVHSPLPGKITGWRYIPGGLLPVNGLTIARVPALFTLNERLTIYLQTGLGQVAVVMIGAMVVGRIRAAFDNIVTNGSRGRILDFREYDKPIPVEAGDELGVFELGSSVVLLFEPGRIHFEEVQAGSLVKLGQVLARARKKERQG